MRVYIAAILALSFTPLVTAPLKLPETSWGTALAMGEEMAFGFAMGLILSFVFVAAQWGGEMIVKPLNRSGGAGIFHVRLADRSRE